MANSYSFPVCPHQPWGSPVDINSDIVHIDIHNSAAADLARLWGLDAAAAAEITVVLEELQSDPTIADQLNRYGDAQIGQHLLNVRRWQAAKPHAPFWRFRVLNTPATRYRVIYSHHLRNRQLCVLAIAHKDDFDYELDSDLGKRILSDWRSL